MDGFHLPAFCSSLSSLLISYFFGLMFEQKPLAKQYGKLNSEKKQKPATLTDFLNVDPKHISALKLMFCGHLITFNLIMQNILLEFGFFSLVMVEYYLKMNLDHYLQQDHTQKMHKQKNSP